MGCIGISPVPQCDQVDGLSGEGQGQDADDAHDHDHEDDPTCVSLRKRRRQRVREGSRRGRYASTSFLVGFDEMSKSQ